MTSRFIAIALATAATAGVFAQESAAQAKPEPSLKAGDKAPPLTVEKWVKAGPVAGFEKGKVYVVEFWATW